jgi:Predicted integral membrane protein (DUF2269)
MIERTKLLSGPIAGGLFVAGFVFGLLAAITGQIDPLRPWLIAAYVLFASAFAVSLLIIDPWVSRLEAAASAAGGDGASSVALNEVIADQRARVGAWTLQVLVIGLVFLMVVKPLG